MILRPETPRSPLVAVLATDGTRITAHFPERNEHFRSALLRLDYHWNSPRGPWSREVDERWNGATGDRLVELAHALLLAGFIVEVPSREVAELAIAGDYQPEHRRWVRGLTSGQHQGWFVVRWPRDEDYYGRAVRLPGARYAAPHVVVPPDAWREVLDFAEAHGFRLSDAAAQFAQAARDRYESMVLAVPVPRAKAATPTALAAKVGEVHPDLRDDDANLDDDN